MLRPPRVMIVAGEASGDLHGGPLAAALRAQRPAFLFGCEPLLSDQPGGVVWATVPDEADLFSAVLFGRYDV